LILLVHHFDLDDPSNIDRDQILHVLYHVLYPHIKEWPYFESKQIKISCQNCQEMIYFTSPKAYGGKGTGG
jgi:hypothetical protein